MTNNEICEVLASVVCSCGDMLLEKDGAIRFGLRAAYAHPSLGTLVCARCCDGGTLKELRYAKVGEIDPLHAVMD